MGIIEKLFGRKPTAAVDERTPRSDAELRNDPSLVRVFDEFGREHFISKEDWRKSVLPGALLKHWNDADPLYDVITGALNDGFLNDIVDAAERLYDLDTDPVRAACVWGIVLTQLKRLDEAEAVFASFANEHGENGYVMTNLAKVYAQRGDAVRAERTLWRALEVEPNQENAVLWYAALHQERDDELERRAALQRVAKLPGSWRAQLWLARAELESGKFGAALALYKESLQQLPAPAPSDALMQISGDLGNSGHAAQLVALVAPHFDAPTHGLAVGNNLIKAHLEQFELDDAKYILEQLYALNRPDWRDTLSYWDHELAKVRLDADPSKAAAQLPTVGLLALEGPVWLKRDSPAATLCPSKQSDAPVVTFLGSSASVARQSQQIERQLADAPGRMSRALPLFLAEQVELGTSARSRTLVPWVTEPSGGFVLAGARWSDADGAAYATQDGEQNRYVVLAHLDATTDEWSIDARLVCTSDGTCVGHVAERFPMGNPGEATAKLAQQLCELVCRTTDARAQSGPSWYSAPRQQMNAYLLRLEQLLAVRCSSMKEADANFLTGERDIVDGNLQLCLDAPGNTNFRLLLAETLLAMKRVRPRVLAEFAQRVALLQREHPLPPPARNIVQELLDEAAR